MFRSRSVRPIQVQFGVKDHGYIPAKQLLDVRVSMEALVLGERRMAARRRLRCSNVREENDPVPLNESRPEDVCQS